MTVADGGVLEPGVAGVGTLTANSLTFGAATGNAATINLSAVSNYASSPALLVNGNVTALAAPARSTSISLVALPRAPTNC